LQDIGERVQAIQGALTDGQETVSPHCESVLESVVRQRKLIDALVEYASIDGTLELRPDVDLTTVLNTVLVECASVLEVAGGAVTRDVLPAVRGDPRLLGRVFSYLLGNAVRFRREEPPRIHVGARESGDW
jgi:signal transduction histidine kinase